MAPGGTRRDFEELVELVRVDVATPPALCHNHAKRSGDVEQHVVFNWETHVVDFPQAGANLGLRQSLRSQTKLNLPPGNCTGQRVCSHAQLGAPRHGTAVFWDTISCRDAAPLTHTLTHAPDSTLWARVTLTFLRSWKTGGPGWNLHARSVLSFSLNLSPHACTHALVGPSAHTHGVAPAQGCWEHRWSPYPVPTRWKSVMWVAQALLHKALGPLGELWRLRGSSTGLGPSVTTKSFPTALVAMSSG
jgi:hypothetical protein